MKVKDLTFIDIGLPSGNKICIQYIDKLNKARFFNQKLSYLLPTPDEIREILLFCTLKPISKTLKDISYPDENEDLSQNEPDKVNGIEVIGLNNSFFIPFLGFVESDIIQNINEQALIMNQQTDDEYRMSASVFTKNQVAINSMELNRDSYVQIILIKRNGTD